VRSLILAVACTLSVCALAACGGGGGGSKVAAQTIRGTGFVFQGPGDWHVRRTDDKVTAAPSPIARELVQVAVFPLQRSYRPALFELEVSKELDPYARQLAAQQHGSLVGSKNVQVAGIRSRQYDLGYSRGGHDLRERIIFVFREKTEYELLCQWDASKSEPAYCGQLVSSFRPT
jgi:hypothetical protein